eukprot:TRINITY_DN25900_c0_g1_i1.p1 TRINITY_DN25900_c0_g1~~TRINITY_DN25900_c0_g1_i1.p1  ORF type:complete len:127 (+),score=14.19 TRINITY_DN25900_c0_g1_i1:1-381(+)
MNISFKHCSIEIDGKLIMIPNLRTKKPLNDIQNLQLIERYISVGTDPSCDIYFIPRINHCRVNVYRGGDGWVLENDSEKDFHVGVRLKTGFESESGRPSKWYSIMAKEDQRFGNFVWSLKFGKNEQ